MANTTRPLENRPGHCRPAQRDLRALTLALLPVLLALLLPAAAGASAPQGWHLVDSSGNLDYEDHTASYGAEIQSAAGAFNAVGAVSAQPSSGAGTDVQIGESSLAPGVGGVTNSDGRILFPPQKGAYPYTAVAHEFGHAEGLAHVPTGSVTDQDPSTHYEAPTPSDEQVLLDIHGGGNGGGSDTGGGSGDLSAGPSSSGGSDLDAGSDLGGGGSILGGGASGFNGAGLQMGGGNVHNPQTDTDHVTDVSGDGDLGDGGAKFGASLAGITGGSGSGGSSPGGGSDPGGGSGCSLDLGSAVGGSFRSDVDGFLGCMRGGGSSGSAPGAGGPKPSGARSMPSGGGGSSTPGQAGSGPARSPESGGGGSGFSLSDSDPGEYEGMLEDFLSGGGNGQDK